MAGLTFLHAIIASFIGTVLALVAYSALTGRKGEAGGALARLFGGLERYGTYSPVELKGMNAADDPMYEFPQQRNNARRPARTNNRTLPAVYPTSGAPSPLPTAPFSFGGTRTPGGPDAAAHEMGIWRESAGQSGFGEQLLEDLLPSETAAPVKSFNDVFGSRLAGTASRVPIDS